MDALNFWEKQNVAEMKSLFKSKYLHPLRQVEGPAAAQNIQRSKAIRMALENSVDHILSNKSMDIFL